MSGREGHHLWFVLTDPDAGTGKVVAVMLVTAKPHTDRTVAVHAGDHPFVRHESHVAFGSARFFPAARLEARIRSNDIKPAADMTPVLLAKVRAGLLDSSRTIHEIKDYCRQLFGEALGQSG